jgi:hypothetical protein
MNNEPHSQPLRSEEIEFLVLARLAACINENVAALWQ